MTDGDDGSRMSAPRREMSPRKVANSFLTDGHSGATPSSRCREIHTYTEEKHESAGRVTSAKKVAWPKTHSRSVTRTCDCASKHSSARRTRQERAAFGSMRPERDMCQPRTSAPSSQCSTSCVGKPTA